MTRCEGFLVPKPSKGLTCCVFPNEYGHRTLPEQFKKSRPHRRGIGETFSRNETRVWVPGVCDGCRVSHDCLPPRVAEYVRDGRSGDRRLSFVLGSCRVLSRLRTETIRGMLGSGGC